MTEQQPEAEPILAILAMNRAELLAFARANFDLAPDPEIPTKKLRAALLALQGQSGAVIEEALHPDRTPPDPADDPPIPPETPDPAPPGKGKKSKRFKRRLTSMLRHWALIYSTNTVWDGEYRQVVKLDNLKLSSPGPLVKAWLNHPERRMILPKQLVFEPSGQVQPGEINLFNGWPLKPDPEKSCALLIRHLYRLCGEDDELFHWVACWLAYPLQHPGTKMATCLVVHGKEGTGKNLFFDTVGTIYGEYADIIGQEQIESQFNDWLSGKLYMVANEVVSHQELRHLKGRLKHLITGEAVQVNGKNMPLRRERNHINLVFLSNELIPVILDPSDRRHTVIWTEQTMKPAEIAEVVDEIAAGGAAGLYAWLLAYDTGEFGPHTKPYDNEARRSLIHMSMKAAEKFLVAWREGETELPYATCAASDLYKGFRLWCAQAGEQYFANAAVFGKTVCRELPHSRRMVTDYDLKEKKDTIYWVDVDKHAEIDGAWLSRAVMQFRETVELLQKKHKASG